MEIIDELEPQARSTAAPAATSLRRRHGRGDRHPHRHRQDGTLYVQAAAGVVADSVPEMEWKETEHKARALIRAAELVEEVLDGRRTAQARRRDARRAMSRPPKPNACCAAARRARPGTSPSEPVQGARSTPAWRCERALAHRLRPGDTRTLHRAAGPLAARGRRLTTFEAPRPAIHRRPGSPARWCWDAGPYAIVDGDAPAEERPCC